MKITFYQWLMIIMVGFAAFFMNQFVLEYTLDKKNIDTRQLKASLLQSIDDIEIFQKPEEEELPPVLSYLKENTAQDSDGDSITDIVESEVWGTDPGQANTDGDNYSDPIEIKNGYNPLLPDAKQISEEERTSRNEGSKKLTEELAKMSEKEGAIYFVGNRTTRYNQYEHEEGLFRFDYKNTQVTKRNGDIVYLEDLSSGKVTFQIFENDNRYQFDETAYYCVSSASPEEKVAGKTVCFSKNIPNAIVLNIELFGRRDRIARMQMARLSMLSELEYHHDVKKYDFFTRAQALELVLSLRYPEVDFSQYAGKCFEDVDKDHPLSGYICYAQKEKTVIGINGWFYPDSSVNLYGILKILFKTFEIEDLKFDERKVADEPFLQMQKTHYAYPLIAKALYEGIFENFTDESLWSNQSVTRGEVIQITHNFLAWKGGKKIKKYIKNPEPALEDPVVITEANSIYNLTPKEKLDTEDHKKTEIYFDENNDVFMRERGGIYSHVIRLDEYPESIEGYYNADKLNLALEVKYADRTELLQSDPENEQYRFIKKNYTEERLLEIKNKLRTLGIMPNGVSYPDANLLPTIKVYMEPSDFHDIYVNRTVNSRYPGYLEMTYPDGKISTASILIKTRGNANRGYVKSSYTIEAYEDFGENKAFKGDEFLKKNDEVKLRSFINEETLIHEKLFYDLYKKLGHIAPDFFGATLTINGIPMGLYQVTEPVKKPFFKDREISTDDYFYARNVDSEYNTNLKYHQNDPLTLSQYKVVGDGDKLIDLIKALEANEEEFIWSIDKESIYDYAFLTYLTNADDSLTHNYYVYIDETSKTWKIFPWDADACFEDIPAISRYGFQRFTKEDTGIFNNLILYLFNNLDTVEDNFYFQNFKKKWVNNVDLIEMIEGYETDYAPYFIYENELWNGRHIERKKTVFDTMTAIEELKEEVKQIDNYLIR